MGKAAGTSPLFNLLARHLAAGVVIGLGLAAAFYALDIGGIRALAGSSAQGPLALGMFAFAMAATFGALAMGAGVMAHPRDAQYGADARRPREEDDAPSG